MKRSLMAVGCLCMALVLMLALLIPIGATDSDPVQEAKADWLVYSQYIDDAYNVQKDTPPEAIFTDAGFGTTSGKGIKRYALGTARPLVNVNDGLYMEVTVEKAMAGTTLALSLWSQAYIVPDTTNYGSGWYALIKINENSELEAMDACIAKRVLQATTGIVIPADTSRGEGTLTFTLRIREGVLTINDVPIQKEGAIVSFLNSLDQKRLYACATMIATMGNSDTSPMTINRFGRNQDTAYVPGYVPPPAETVIIETDPPTDPETARPDEPPTSDDGGNTRDTLAPTDSGNGSSTAKPEDDPAETTKPAGAATGKPDGAKETAPKDEPIHTEPETTNELSFFLGLYEKAGGCASVIGSAVLTTMAALAVAAYSVRKKHD